MIDNLKYVKGLDIQSKKKYIYLYRCVYKMRLYIDVYSVYMGPGGNRHSCFTMTACSSRASCVDVLAARPASSRCHRGTPSGLPPHGRCPAAVVRQPNTPATLEVGQGKWSWAVTAFPASPGGGCGLLPSL